MICPSLIVIENFYENPDEVREYALQQRYTYDANEYPGKRTINKYYPENIHNTFKTILAPYYSNVNLEQNTSNGEFQITNKNDKSWIHMDLSDDKSSTCKKVISGVCYLTPNAPLDSGTTFYKKDLSNNEYIQTDVIHNKYNRLILFDGTIFHMSSKYFGTTDNDSRLTQVFFLECS